MVHIKYEWKVDEAGRQHFFMEGDRLRSSVFQLGGHAVQVCAKLEAKGANDDQKLDHLLVLRLETVAQTGDQRQKPALPSTGRWMMTLKNCYNKEWGMCSNNKNEKKIKKYRSSPNLLI
jgi:hypothetical protein